MSAIVDRAKKVVAAAEHVDKVLSAIGAVNDGMDTFARVNDGSTSVGYFMGYDTATAVCAALRVDKVRLETLIKTEVKAWLTAALKQAEEDLAAERFLLTEASRLAAARGEAAE